MSNIVFHLILLAYLAASLVFWLHLGLRQRWLFRLATGCLGSGLTLQTGFLAYRLSVQPSLLWSDLSTSLGMLSWAITMAYLVAVRRYHMDALGPFVVPFAFLASASSGVSTVTADPVPIALQHLWLGMHIVLALLGYAALTLTFGAGIMYLIQERQLKSRHPGVWWQRLPSLSLLDELGARALLLGFPLLTQGIITGSIWAEYTYGSYLRWSLTSVPLLLGWLIYGFLLGGRRLLGWQGKKAAYATVGGFIIVLASYFVHTL